MKVLFLITFLIGIVSCSYQETSKNDKDVLEKTSIDTSIKKLNEQNKNMETITIIGTAYDAKSGAVIQSENGEVYYLENLDYWAEEFSGKKVKVSGNIKSEYFDEKDLKNEKGEYTQGMSGEKQSIKNAKWELIEK